MAGCVAVIAALPRELKALVRGIRAAPASQPGVFLYRTEHAVFVAAGMGSTRASVALEAALAGAEVTEVLSVGLAGACAPTLQPGRVAEPSLVVEVRTGERFRTAGPAHGPVLVSTETIASVAEKERLHATYGADLVDMEAATLARLAVAHGLPFRAVKGISDAHNFELALLERFTGPRGAFRTGAFALHTALRPGQWKAALTLGKGSSAALAALTTEVRALLQHRAGQGSHVPVSQGDL